MAGIMAISQLTWPATHNSSGSFPVEGAIKVRREKSEEEPHWGTSASGRGGHYHITIFDLVFPCCRRRADGA